MRVVAIVLGGLLLIGGGLVVVAADQQRQEALDQSKAWVEQAEQRLADARQENLDLAEQLTTLRSTIADQDAALSDTRGFLQ